MKRKNLAFISDLTPVRREVVSIQEFKRLSEESPHMIAKSRFVSPTIGKRDFGSFEVMYTVPFFRHSQEIA